MDSVLHDFEKRATCYNSYTRQYYYCQSRWGSWGRWVALAVIIIVALIFFFLIACISQRRRRKAGSKPFYGTGWTSNIPGGKYNGQTYNPQYGNQNNYNPPPQYGAQTENAGYYGNQSGGANQSYFGGQRNDVEMQPPQNVYGNNNNYAPPSGPPPAKY